MPKQEKNIPVLRFPEFKGEWVNHTFESLYRCVPTNSFSRNDLQEEPSEISNIHYGDIHTAYNSKFKFSSERVPFVINEKFDKLRNYARVKKGDLIFADASEDVDDIGKMIEVVELGSTQLVSGLHTIHATPKKANSMASGFPADLFKTTKLRRQIIKESQGAKVLGLSAKKLAKTTLIIPEYKEQQKIAAFLGAVDDKIAQLQKKKDLLENYKKGCMQKLFSQEIRFSDENGNAFPDWTRRALKQVAKIYDGTHQTPKYVSVGVPFYSVEHVTSNNFQSTKFIEEDVFLKECKRIKIEKNDILMTRIGDIGTCRLVDWDVRASFYVSLALLKLSCDFLPVFACQFIQSDYFQRELWHRTIHVAFPKKINLGEIGECKIKLPHLEEQRKIGEFLLAQDKKIALVAEELDKAKAFKKGLLQQMFV